MRQLSTHFILIFIFAKKNLSGVKMLLFVPKFFVKQNMT